MISTFEYLVCQSQIGKVTFVNGEWVGDPDVLEVREQMFDSCPNLWDFLNQMGPEGWELVAAYSLVASDGQHFERLILKRPR